MGEGDRWARRVARIIYDLPEGDAIYKEATKRFRGWNNVHGQAQEAAWWMRDRFMEVAEDHGFDFYDKMTDEEQDALLDELGEAIFAWLT